MAIDWRTKTLSYFRAKTGQPARICFDQEVEKILRRLPSKGPLFPYLQTVRASDRATEFKQRCQGLKIEGVTLYSYRYSWAEQAREAGYPERAAQEVLGHELVLSIHVARLAGFNLLASAARTVKPS